MCSWMRLCAGSSMAETRTAASSTACGSAAACSRCGLISLGSQIEPCAPRMRMQVSAERGRLVGRAVLPTGVPYEDVFTVSVAPANSASSLVHPQGLRACNYLVLW